MLNIVILAAGAGKRMQSDLPKVLHTLAGRPMLAHVLASARALQPALIVVVVGHGSTQVRAACANEPDVIFAEQTVQHGTGHAVQQAVPYLLTDDTDADVTLVLYGDVPLVAPATLRALLQARADANGLAILTEHLPDATGYGRIVRSAQGDIIRVVEHKDASADELAISEVNTGMLAAPTGRLKHWLASLKNDNAQGEFYLTDIIGFAVADGVPVASAQPGAA